MSGSEALKVVIVEDEASIRRIIKRILPGIFPGVSIEEASNGREGLQKIRDFRPNLVIMDLRMPFMDGLEVLEELHKEGILEDMAVVIISGFPPEGRQFSEIFRYGSNVGFLQKPFMPDTFKVAIQERLEEGKKEKK